MRSPVTDKVLFHRMANIVGAIANIVGAQCIAPLLLGIIYVLGDRN